MNYIILIIGMTAVTYLPRLIPMITLSSKEIPRRLRLFLEAIPLAALGALIFPDALYSIPGKPLLLSTGLLLAAIAAAVWRNLIVSVIISLSGMIVLSQILQYW